MCHFQLKQEQQVSRVGCPVSSIFHLTAAVFTYGVCFVCEFIPRRGKVLSSLSFFGLLIILYYNIICMALAPFGCLGRRVTWTRLVARMCHMRSFNGRQTKTSKANCKGKTRLQIMCVWSESTTEIGTYSHTPYPPTPPSIRFTIHQALHSHFI